MKVAILLMTCLGLAVSKTSVEELRLPKEHIPYFFTNNPELREECRRDSSCKFKNALKEEKCWGYEKECKVENRMSMPVCPGEARGWVRDKESQKHEFWKQGDFGYLKEKREELTPICKPREPSDSSLECVKFTRFCRAKNIFLDFTTSKLKEGSNRFREDVFQVGQVGGYCDLDKKALEAEGQHKSALQSWYAELENYTELKENPFETEGMCDITIEKPTFIMKLDAGVNMYHHFCDFMNLYMTQHLNNSFTTDMQIMMWDTSPLKYGDFFHITWQAFSLHPIIQLANFDGKKVCIKDALFSLLPRMRYGHFYNMPLIPGCEKTGMYRAFSHHMIHRMNLTQEGPLKDKIRVTLLSRGSKYRNILNEKEIVNALNKVGHYEVTVAKFSPKTPFLEQLKVTHNSDIFMGMHGAGLTHQLFQPDWGVIFEVYNCDDENCYKDLARLRGLRYMTWEKMDKLIQEDEGHHPTLGAHKKFTNYEFDVTEFLRMVANAAQYVRSHPAYRNAKKAKYHREEL